MRVVVVDDSAVTASLFAMVLSRAGHKVETTTTNFRRLLSEGRWKGIDAAVIDGRLESRRDLSHPRRPPTVSGQEIVSFLAQHCPHVRRVVVSGLEAPVEGAHVQFLKPVNINQLIAAVEGRDDAGE